MIADTDGACTYVGLRYVRTYVEVCPSTDAPCATRPRLSLDRLSAAAQLSAAQMTSYPPTPAEQIRFELRSYVEIEEAIPRCFAWPAAADRR